MTNIVILDDDRENAADLRERVERLLPRDLPHCVTEVTTLASLMGIIAAGDRIDLLITDIVMPEGQPSGIDIVRQLFPPACGTQVIYVSGYLDRALDVYPTNHLYFLLKPVEEERLREALDLALAATRSQRPAMLRIKVGHKEQLINTATIVYLRSNLRVAEVCCRDRSFETYARLSDLAAQLPGGFVQCHRSYVVNLSYVISLKEDAVRLYDGTLIPVSRRRAKEVQRAMLEHISRRAKA